MHLLFYARLANKPYNEKEVTDAEVVLTVSAYSDNHDIAARQGRMTSAELRQALLTEYPTLDWEYMIASMRNMMSDLFGKAANSVGCWPQSSAYYAVDVLFDGSTVSDSCAFTPQPFVLEVNFMGDWKGVRAISNDLEEFNEWAHDLFLCLGTRKPLDGNARLQRI